MTGMASAQQYVRSRSAALIIPVALFALALAVRLPYWSLVPSYTDEGGEVLWALDIATGKHLPLTALDGYEGPLFPYLIAFGFRLFGTSTDLARLVAVLAGSLTVVATYALGSLTSNRLGGVIAACFAAFSPYLVVYLSHYGWSSSLVPLFSTATAACAYAGVKRDSNKLLALSGLFAGLTLQVHPTTAAFLLGLVLWVVTTIDRRQWFGRGVLGAVGLFVLAYSPIILTHGNVNSPLLNDAQLRTYAFAPSLNPLEYSSRMIMLLRSIASMIGGVLPPITVPVRVIEGMVVLTAFVGVIVGWRAHIRLPALVFLTALAVLPIFLVGFSYRYFSFLLPMACVAMGIAATEIWRRLHGTRNRLWMEWPGLRAPARMLFILLAGVLFISPLWIMTQFYSDAVSKGQTNAGYVQLAKLLRSSGACGARLFVENPQAPPNTPAFSAAFVVNSIDYVLTMDDCKHAVLPARVSHTVLDLNQDNWLILDEQNVARDYQPSSEQLVTTINMPIFSDLVPISVYRVRTAP